MIDINGIQPAGAPNPIEPVNKALEATKPADAPPISDTVEISMAARLAAKVQEMPEVRADLVASVKAEIEAGTYETPERLEIAINRLLDDLLLP
ncbi:MAG TPA: flagellar biosynthesis anti-sigma factor FlgM [Phycisphaerae bacterium]|nr:flagellar biosynthesis anti-sigma factor FlgM [Phycisphaerae bacterium]